MRALRGEGRERVRGREDYTHNSPGLFCPDTVGHSHISSEMGNTCISRQQQSNIQTQSHGNRAARRRWIQGSPGSRHNVRYWDSRPPRPRDHTEWNVGHHIAYLMEVSM